MNEISHPYTKNRSLARSQSRISMLFLFNNLAYWLNERANWCVLKKVFALLCLALLWLWLCFFETEESAAQFPFFFVLVIAWLNKFHHQSIARSFDTWLLLDPRMLFYPLAFIGFHWLSLLWIVYCLPIYRQESLFHFILSVFIFACSFFAFIIYVTHFWDL